MAAACSKCSDCKKLPCKDESNRFLSKGKKMFYTCVNPGDSG